MESDDFKTALEVALQFFPGIKLKRENRSCASKACLSNEKTSSSEFCRLGISNWLFHRPALSIGQKTELSLFSEGLHWAPSALLSQVLLAFGVTSVARLLALNRNKTTCCRRCQRCLWSGALEAIHASLLPRRVPYHPPMPLVTQWTFCSNSLFS